MFTSITFNTFTFHVYSIFFKSKVFLSFPSSYIQSIYVFTTHILLSPPTRKQDRLKQFGGPVIILEVGP